MKKFVAGVGRLNVDLLYKGLPRLPEEGEELYCEGFYMGLGGGVPGSLVSLSRLGIDVKLGTWLGNDYLSDFAGSRLQEEGVVPENLYNGQGIPVNITSAMLTPRDRTFVTYGCVASQADEKEVYAVCKGADTVLMQLGGTEAYRKLKNEGTRLILDPGYDQNMTLKGYRDYLELADFYLPNRKEALTITGESSYQKAAQKLSVYTGRAIVKLDGGGAYIYEGGKGIVVPPTPAVHKDSTGAGDAFLAGFVYGLIKGLDLEVAVMCGNIAGANCVSDYGCLTARLAENELISRLSTHYGIKL